MANNKGKKGEMKALELISKMGQIDDSPVDVTRPTVTNMPDLGLDLGLHHTEQHFDEMLKIAAGEQNAFSNPADDHSRKMQTRIDVKNEDSKTNKPQMSKFISDIKKHPDCKGHILMGNDGLTAGAAEVLKEAQENFPEQKIAYISNTGVKNLFNVVETQLSLEEQQENK